MSNNKDFKIIGITGSYGKTTTIKIVNEYLKAKGKRSVLFASCGIDRSEEHTSELQSR